MQNLDSNPEINYRVNLDLMRRGMPGTWSYILLLAALAWFTNFPSKHPPVFAAIVVVTICSTGLRYVTLRAGGGSRGADSRRWRVKVAFIYAIPAAMWAIMFSYSIYLDRFEGFDVFVMLASNLALTCLVPYVASPLPWLARLFLASLLMPTVVAGLLAGNNDGYKFAVLFLVYFAFQWVVNDVLSREYWERLATQEELRNQALRLQEARLSAESANQSKSQFLANITHEIRTPISGVIGITSLVLATNLEAEQQELISMAKSSAEVLLDLLNDLLDFAKIEAGRMDLEALDFDLRETVDGAMKLFTSQAMQKGLRLAVELEPGLPEFVRGDGHRLRQILLNLIGNAVKFTHAGSITVTVKAATAAGNTLQFDVSDTGIGIAAEQLESIFLAFQQADGSMTRKYGGTGLGLTISRCLVELMGGKLWVTSTPQQGTTFSFTGTFASAERKESTLQAVPKPWVAVPMRILVAEDNKINQVVALKMLQKLGHVVTLAENGIEAVEKAISDRYELILMDLQMPELNGIEAVMRIRRWESEQELRSVPVFALTANGDAESARRCMEAGMNGVLPKPFQISELMALMESCKIGEIEKSVVAPRIAVH